MFIPTYEVREESRRVSYWNSLLAEYKEQIEKEKSDKDATYQAPLVSAQYRKG